MRVARIAWLLYAGATIVGALMVLAIYVNTYDDYDISDRLLATGAFARRTMSLLSFPLGGVASAVAGDALEKAFSCGSTNAPCAIFVDWNLRFAAIIAQLGLLRWALSRLR